MKKLLDKAIVLATTGHAGQVDKGGHPYILHPLRIMTKMKTIEEMIVAVLHDLIEDTSYTYNDLRKEGFPEHIIEAIDSITKRQGETYFDFIERAKTNKIGRNVKKKDIEDNSDISRIPNPTEKDYKRLEKYKKAMERLNS